MVFAVLLGEKVMVMVMYMHKRARLFNKHAKENNAHVCLSVCLCVCVCVCVCPCVCVL